MDRRRGAAEHAVLTLLRSVRERDRLGGTCTHGDIVPALAESVIAELASSGARSRRFAILRRSDVAGEKHAAIAADLGVSRSQFYRDLQTARAEFAETLQQRMAASAAPFYFERFAKDVRMTAVHALRLNGRYREACDTASSIARSLDAEGAVEALCLRAEIENEVGAFDRAAAGARSAKALLKHISQPDIRRFWAAHCDLTFFEATHNATGADWSARRARLLQGFRAHGGSEPRRSRVLLKALVQEASELFERDRLRQAAAAIDDALRFIPAAQTIDRRLAVEARIRASGIHALDPQRVATELNTCAELAEAGRRECDPYMLRVGMQMMSAHFFSLGRLGEARNYAIESQALIELFGTSVDRLIVLSNLARIDVHRGDGAGALSWVALAEDIDVQAPAIRTALQISQAEALVLVSDLERAAPLSRDLDSAMQRWPRLQGRAKLARAAVQAALGQHHDAARLSDEAVELSKGTGGIPLQLRALALNVKLTGNRRSRHTLRELQSALSA